MLNSATVMATVVVGAMLVIGTATGSMARGDGHGGSHGGMSGASHASGHSTGAGSHGAHGRSHSSDLSLGRLGGIDKSDSRAIGLASNNRFGHDHDIVSACRSMYRSYVSANSTYLGLDGLRHTCGP
jgi:hypothetical protein